jgi:NAD-dependent SIR2 family protein deacetylase
VLEHQRESGIPTFRDARSGLWEKFDPAQLATSEAFCTDPSLCWGWYEWRRLKVVQAEPNGAHRAIAELAKHLPKLTVVTQNVDDLHERAGSRDVIHLHGSLHSPRCIGCIECIDCGLSYTLPLASDALPEDGSRIEPPRCNICSAYVRPGVVWFGEMLPEGALSAGLAAAKEYDVFLSIGTFGIVYPADELPLRALSHDATVVHINPVRFDISSQEHFLQGPASVMMQSLLREAFG